MSPTNAHTYIHTYIDRVPIAVNVDARHILLAVVVGVHIVLSYAGTHRANFDGTAFVGRFSYF